MPAADDLKARPPSTRATVESRPAARLPPGPPGTFGLRNVFRFSSGPLELLRELADRHGDLVHFRMLGRDYVLVCHPSDIEKVMVKSARVMLRDAYTRELRRALGFGLLTSDGELWKRQRKLMAQAFTPRRIRDYGASMVDIAERGIEPFRDDQEINVHAEMSRITMEVVAGVLFGSEVSRSDVAIVSGAMASINEFFASSPEALLRIPDWMATPRNRRLRAAVSAIDGLLYQLISRRRAEPPRDDLLGTLLAAQDDEGAGMNDQQLRDESITLFLAGHETTALTLANTLYLLSLHPDVDRRLRGEVLDVLGDRAPTVDDVPKLSYTERVLKESMRVLPPAWTTGREATEAIELGGYAIPCGTQLLMSQWIVHRDPRSFPNPEGFDPDRWEPDRLGELPRYAYFPFGGGPRVCIGNHFAMMEATLILASLVRRFRFELVPGQRLELLPTVTLRQRGDGLRMRIRSA